jgi:hypothetical protein
MYGRNGIQAKVSKKKNTHRFWVNNTILPAGKKPEETGRKWKKRKKTIPNACAANSECLHNSKQPTGERTQRMESDP